MSGKLVIPVHSVEESLGHGAGSVDVDHEGGESSTTVHHVLLDDGKGLVNVSLIGVLTLDEFRVDQGLCHLETLISPLGEVAGVKVGLVDGVGGGKSVRLSSVPIEGGGREGKARAASVLVQDGVPNEVKAADTIL